MLLETLTGTETGGWSAPLPTTMDSDRTAVVVFGAPTFGQRPELLRALRHAFPRASILGCSSAGEIHQTSLSDDSVVVAIARFEAVTPRVVSVPIGQGAASFLAGEEIARRLAAPDLRAIFLLSEGLAVNGSELVRGINAHALSTTVVTGGLAADGERFQHTWVFDGHEIAPHRAVALGLFGDRLAVTHGSNGGWDIFGPERRITKADANILYELDGRPALKLYKEYLGARAAGLPATALLYPLAIRSIASGAEQIVRTVLAVSEEDQSLTFAGNVPEGALAQLMRANSDRLIEGAAGAGTLARGRGAANDAVLSLAISCVGRRLVLGERTEEEVEAALEELPPQTKQVGFYAYGEISPLASGSCALHNQTMTLTTLSERA